MCTGGDVPHTGAAIHYPNKTKSYGTLRVHRRCTRTATVQVRRVVDTEGKPIARADATWYHYCASCGAAIVRHQGTEVESREIPK